MSRRFIAVMVLLALVVAGVEVRDRLFGPRVKTEVLGVKLTPAPGLERLLPSDPGRGIVYAGLERVAGGPCGVALRAPRSGRCTHGPDPAPGGVDVRKPLAGPRTTAGDQGAPDAPARATAQGVVCDGDGTSGRRVHALYARASDRADRYATFLSSFRDWAGVVDSVFDQSAALTGGGRRPRFVTDGGCNVVVDNVTLSVTGDDTIDNTMSELESKGYNRADRHYLAWVDANVYCGIASMWLDDQPGQANANNSGAFGPNFARVDSGCWGFASSVEAHELLHALGGVQRSAPHSTPNGHCTDERDRMCYDDDGPGGVSMTSVCDVIEMDRLFDCGADDYLNTAPAAGSYLSTKWNVANSGFLITGPAVAGQYTPLVPARILDTRTGTGGFSSPLGGGGIIYVKATGVGGVPATGVSTVVLNVAVTNTTVPSHLTIFPAGLLRPNAASLNWAGDQTISNLVTAKVGAGGKVGVYLNAGQADVIFDVAGWYANAASGAAGRYRPVTPGRILDTREGTGGFSTLGPGSTIDVQVAGAGQGLVPGSGASAAVLNVAVTNTSQPSHLTIFPTGEPPPTAANLNWAAGATIPNRVVAKLGTAGKVSVYLNAGTADVIIDAGGWFTDASDASGPPGAVSALPPVRILDTREGIGGFSAAVAGGGSIDVQVLGLGGVPPAGATAAVMNVAVTNTALPSHVTIYPAGVTRPNAADLNFAQGQTISNAVVVKLGAGGKVTVFLNAGSADVVFDVVGWFS